MLTLREKHQQHHFTVTVELDPPKSASPKKTENEALQLTGWADAVNIADCPMAKLRMSPIALAHIIQMDFHLETIFHLTCRDRNLIGLQAELLGASALGVHNILTLTGDSPAIGDHPDARAVYETDSTGLIAIARTLNSGFDMTGHPLSQPTHFYIGTTGNPAAPDLDQELTRLSEKKKTGAQFVQTQPVYDLRQAEAYLEGTRQLGLPVLFGVLPLKSYNMALYLHERVPGIVIPKPLQDAMAEGGRETGIAIAAHITAGLRDLGAAGVHLLPINDIPAVPSIIQQAGLPSR